jgi:hypothetical protein
VAVAAIKKRKPEKIYFRYSQGRLIPADPWAMSLLVQKGFKEGQIVSALIRKLRNHKFNNLIHKIGALCVEQLDAFRYLDAHGVIKRVQLEGCIECDELGVDIDGEWHRYRIPRSLSFESMDEAEYLGAALSICAFIRDKYWPTVEVGQIAQMAELMPMERAA